MSQAPDVKELLSSAKEEGSISQSTFELLSDVDIGARIQAGLGLTVDDVQASEVFLVTLLIDDSGSIRFAGNTQVMRDGNNLIIDSLIATKQVDNILMSTRYLNGDIISPFVLIDQAVRLDTSNYDPNGGTPLYDMTLETLGTVLVKSQEFADQGVMVRSITVIVSDGNDQHSPRQHGGRGTAPADCAELVKKMLLSEQHIVAAMGIDDGTTDFKDVFRSMGIHDEWILTPGNNESEIRHAWGFVSQSAVRASQGAASFSETALGGFGEEDDGS